MMFSNEDIIAIHTIIGAAYNLSHDLANIKHPDQTWDHIVAGDHNKKLSNLLHLSRSTQNALKHAKNDPAKTIEITQHETDVILFQTLLNIGLLLDKNELFSIEAQVFQLWFIAIYQSNIAAFADADMIHAANIHFPDIRSKSREEQLQFGEILLKTEAGRGM